ncbi:uncharacterized protein FIBRA_08790 [Fibroporia radiculosa]|uniref:Uncharacterized protein n=1 Tax=Fibroporia radiculosa TaxID=599839 RepID=J4GI89_9APHY|nr:uncharacterized protein FIBRA_08790 [Fibroporia radiculosa]CCM06518.1 predicted protein [Fibroporia radiculosa]
MARLDGASKHGDGHSPCGARAGEVAFELRDVRPSVRLQTGSSSGARLGERQGATISRECDDCPRTPLPRGLPIEILDPRPTQLASRLEPRTGAEASAPDPSQALS